MPKLSDHQSSKFTKLLYLGDSSTGKTGSLVSLLQAGYKFRIVDMDNGLDSLFSFAKQLCPDKLNNVEYETIRDVYKATPSGVICQRPRAFVEASQLLTKWTSDEDPEAYGEDMIYVIDSLTAFGKASLDWARGLNPSSKDGRQWYNTAQQAVENIIALVTSEAFKANVIVITHVQMREAADGTIKGFPNAVGAALGPHLAKYFNTLILAESRGSGDKVRRVIKTVPTGSIDLKNPAPFRVDKELPLETGLATLFTKLKES